MTLLINVLVSTSFVIPKMKQICTFQKKVLHTYIWGNESYSILQKDETENQKSIIEIEGTLKQQLKKDYYAEKQNTIKVNETAKKAILGQLKFKKFNTLKYKPEPTVKTINFTEGKELLEKSPTAARPNYAKILKDKKKTNKTNLNNNKTNKNIYEKLRSLSPTIRTRKQGNIRSRNN